MRTNENRTRAKNARNRDPVETRFQSVGSISETSAKAAGRVGEADIRGLPFNQDLRRGLAHPTGQPQPANHGEHGDELQR